MKFRPFLLQTTSRRARCRCRGAHRRRAHRFSLTTAALVTTLASPALGQSGWFFGASQDIQGDQDVFTAGNGTWALNNTFAGTGDTSVTLNGVLFESGNAASSSAGIKWSDKMTFSGQTSAPNVVQNSTAAPFSDLSNGYQALLRNFTSGGNFGNVDLKNLESGRAYVLQAWGNQSSGNPGPTSTKWYSSDRGNPNNASALKDALDAGLATTLRRNTSVEITGFDVEAGGGDETNNKYNPEYVASNATGGLGQHGLIAFRADAGTATVQVAGANDIRINALQVRDVTGYWLGAPETFTKAANPTFPPGSQDTPATDAPFIEISSSPGANVWDHDSPNFMGGMSFAELGDEVDFVAFTDLRLFEGEENFISSTGSLTNRYRDVGLTSGPECPSATGASREIFIADGSTGEEIAIGEVRFENQTETYIFNNHNNGTQGIAGETNLRQTGTGTVILNGENTYTGTTTVEAGTMQINGSSGSGDVEIWEDGRLEGTGTVAGDTIVEGTHAPGTTDCDGFTPGVQKFSEDLTYATGSVFEWNLIGNTNDDRGDSWSGVDVHGDLTVDGCPTFQMVFTDVDFTTTFWKEDRTWRVFDGLTGGDSTTDLFCQSDIIIPDNANYDPSLGSFTLTTDGNLNWTYIPEPSTTLVGVLLAAGILRRRRS